MPKERREPQFRIAPAKSLAGKLQRGLGSGFLEALAAPREVVHELLMDCILCDPRVDGQLDSRDVYYADLAWRIGLPLEPIVEYLVVAAADEDERTYLAMSVLVELARRGSAAADEVLRDYVQWGPFWDSVCWRLGRLATTSAWVELVPTMASRAELAGEAGMWDVEPFTSWAKSESRFAALVAGEQKRWKRRRSPLAKPRGTTATLLQPPKSGPVTPIIDELARTTSLDDLWLIEEATGSPSAMTRAIAVSVQFARGDFSHWDLALDMALHEQHPPYATGIASRAILGAPAGVLLPYAREWKSSRVFRRRYLAWRILEQHATEEFLPWVEAQLERVSARDGNERFTVTTLAEIITNRFPGREFAALGRKFDAFTYSFGRQFLAQALAVTDPTFPTTRAFTSLWDCESSVRLVAVEHVSLEVPGAEERLQEMAGGSLEEDARIRAMVERRLDPATRSLGAGRSRSYDGRRWTPRSRSSA